MILLFTFNPENDKNDIHNMKIVLKTAESWYRVFSNTWLIKTVDPPKMWFEKIDKVTNQFQCLIVDIEDKEQFGWLPTTVWEWIKKQEELS